MAKKWNEIISSDTYFGLSDDDKQKVAMTYWNKVISPSTSYTGLTPENKKQFENRFSASVDSTLSTFIPTVKPPTTDYEDIKGSGKGIEYNKEVPKQLQDLGKIYSMPLTDKVEKPTDKDKLLYTPARIFSAIIEKPAYALAELSARWSRFLTPKDTKAYNYLSGMVDYYGKPEKYALATPTAEKVRAYYREQNYQTNTATGVIGDIIEAGIDLQALIIQMGLIGKADTSSPLVTQPLKRLTKHATKMGIHGFLTTKGSERERIQSAIYRIGYNITPYIANATGATGLTAVMVDTALNTFLTSPTYVQAYKEAGGINKDFLSMAIPQFVMDVGMALSTRGLPENRRKQALNKYYKDRIKELKIPKKEFNTMITNIQSDLSTEKAPDAVKTPPEAPIIEKETKLPPEPKEAVKTPKKEIAVEKKQPVTTEKPKEVEQKPTVREFSILDRETYEPNKILGEYDYKQQKWVTGETARQIKIKLRKDTIEILKSDNAEEFIISQPSPQNKYTVKQALQNEMAELSDLESMGVLKGDKVPAGWKSSIKTKPTVKEKVGKALKAEIPVGELYEKSNEQWNKANKKLRAIAKGHKVTDEELHNVIKQAHNKESIKQLTLKQFKETEDIIKSLGKPVQKKTAVTTAVRNEIAKEFVETKKVTDTIKEPYAKNILTIDNKKAVDNIDKPLNRVVNMEEALSKFGKNTVRLFWKIDKKQKTIERENNVFQKDFNKEVLKKTSKKILVVDDFKNKKFTKKVIEYIISGKTDNNDVKIVGDLYIEKNKDLHKYIRATRIFLYEFTKNKQFIKFIGDDKNKKAEVDSAIKKFHEYLNSNDYDTAINKFVKYIDKYNWGVKEKYIPSEHDLTNDELVNVLMGEQSTLLKTKQYKSGEGKIDPDRFWISFENGIYNSLMNMQAVPLFGEFYKSFSPANKRRLDSVKNSIFKHSDVSLAQEVFGAAFGLSYTGFLDSPSGLKAGIRNLNQNVARNYFLPKVAVTKGLAQLLKNPAKSFKEGKFKLSKEETKLLTMLSSRMAIQDAYLLTHTTFTQTPVIRRLETWSKQAAEYYSWTDQMNRWMAVKYLHPIKQLVDKFDPEKDSIEKLFKTLKLGQSNNAVKAALIEDLMTDKEQFFLNYVRQKVLDVHHDYSKHARPQFMQHEGSKVFAGLMVYPTSSIAKELRLINNTFSPDTKGWEKAQSFEAAALQSYQLWAKKLVRLGISGAIGAGLFKGLQEVLSDDEEKRKKQKLDFAQIKEQEVWNTVGWFISGEIANRSIEAITGREYSKYGVGDITLGSPAMISVADNLREIYNNLIEVGTDKKDIVNMIALTEKNTVQRIPYMSLFVEIFLTMYDMSDISVVKDYLVPLAKTGKIPDRDKLIKIQKELDKRYGTSRKRFYKQRLKDMPILQQLQKTVFGREKSYQKIHDNAIDYKLQSYLYNQVGQMWEDAGKLKKSEEAFAKRDEFYQKHIEEMKKVQRTAKQYKRTKLKVPTKTAKKQRWYKEQRIEEKVNEKYRKILEEE